MSRVVLDTNVVIAALAARGLCEAVFELCLEQHELISSHFLLTELSTKMVTKLKFSSVAVNEILTLCQHNCHMVTPAILDTKACRDHEDLPVLGTCIAGKAEYLVTGDKDFLILKQIADTSILTPREFYEIQKHDHRHY